MPGFIESELTQGKFVSKAGKLEVDQDMRDVSLFLWFSLVKDAKKLCAYLICFL